MKKAIFGTTSMALLVACVSIEDPAVPVNVVVKDAMPREAAINFLEKTTTKDWKNPSRYAVPYPYCNISDKGVTRMRDKQGLFETESFETKKLNTIAFENLVYQFTLVDNSYYTLDLVDKDRLNFIACRVTKSRSSTVESLEFYTKIITAFEALEIEKFER